VKIIATIAVTIERTDGSATTISETTTTKTGDNPRFERAEASKAITRTWDTLANRISQETTA
jgi:hypothetical protein